MKPCEVYKNNPKTIANIKKYKEDWKIVAFRKVKLGDSFLTSSGCGNVITSGQTNAHWSVGALRFIVKEKPA